MKRGPYFFTQYRKQGRNTDPVCYIWCQWETNKGTQGVARSTNRHGVEGAIAQVIKEAEKMLGTRIHTTAEQVIQRLQSMA